MGKLRNVPMVDSMPSERAVDSVGLEEKRKQLEKEAAAEFQTRAQAFAAEYEELVKKHGISIQGVPVPFSAGNGVWAFKCQLQLVPVTEGGANVKG